MPKYNLIKLQSNFIEIPLRHMCSPINLLHIFRKSFPKNTSERMLLLLVKDKKEKDVFLLVAIFFYKTC